MGGGAAGAPSNREAAEPAEAAERPVKKKTKENGRGRVKSASRGEGCGRSAVEP